MAKPTVATTVAHRGLQAVPGQDLMVADEPADIARAVLDLLGDPARRIEMGAAARRHVVALYDWSACLDPLDTLLGLTAQPKD